MAEDAGGEERQVEASSSFGGPSLWVEVGRSSLVMAREEVRAGGDVGKLPRWKKSVGRTRKPWGRRCGPGVLSVSWPGAEDYQIWPGSGWGGDVGRG